ncbi:MAG: DUF4398 domain-containing protein [Gallionellaceae bacterium]|nr:MAG: DUF4398 domain-containing protein [Gallionellaceae bacterium]
MDSSKNIFLVCWCVLVLGGCSTVLSCDDGRDVRWFSSPTEHMLNNGIKSYEDGNYAVSMTTLQELIDNKEAANSQRVEAYKYMAFMHCLSAREKMCRDSFKKALEIDVGFNLSPAEAGHPVWGPVFNSVKKTAK